MSHLAAGLGDKGALPFLGGGYHPILTSDISPMLEVFFMPGSIRCPQCGHVLFAIDAPIAPSASPPPSPEVPLLLRMTEAARLLGVSRSTMYQIVGSGEVPVVRLGRSVRVVRARLEAWVAAARV